MNDYLRGYLDGIRDERERFRDDARRAIQDSLLKLRKRVWEPRPPTVSLDDELRDLLDND